MLFVINSLIYMDSNIYQYLMNKLHLKFTLKNNRDGKPPHKNQSKIPSFFRTFYTRAISENIPKIFRTFHPKTFRKFTGKTRFDLFLTLFWLVLGCLARKYTRKSLLFEDVSSTFRVRFEYVLRTF